MSVLSLLGFGGGATRQRSRTDAQSSGRSFVDASQQPFLDFLRNQAQGQFGGFNQAQNQFASQLAGFGQQATNQQVNPFMGQLLDTAQGNPQLLAAQSDDLTNRIQNFTNQNIANLNRGAVGSMGLGGGRNQVARGTAIGQGADALTSGLLGLQDQAQARRLSAGQIGGGMFNQQNALRQAGLGLAGDFSGMAFNSQFQPLAALQQYFGAPTVLQENQMTSKTRSKTDQFNLNPFFG